MTDSNDKKNTASKVKTNSGSNAKVTTTQAAAKSALKASTLPSADELKDRFKAGSIPLQTDFGDLIDLANTGAQASGQASGQSGAGKGLTLTDGLLEVKAGNGIAVSASGVSIDPNTVLPKGIITMFSGSNVPEGWLFCDGTKGTPDLRDRFIMGGYVEDIGGKSTATFSGNKDAKAFSFTSGSASVEFNGTTAGTSLNTDQIPNHQHNSGIRFYDKITFEYGDILAGGGRQVANGIKNENQGNLSITSGINNSKNSMGSSKEHSHNFNFSTDHSHETDISVPYYILAFIMKS